LHGRYTRSGKNKNIELYVKNPARKTEGCANQTCTTNKINTTIDLKQDAALSKLKEGRELTPGPLCV
jgi:hypothetical protein